jgi:hypothetical protein
MLPTTLPALSEDGWVTSTAEKADYLISHFFVSEYSQTLLYPGNVASFPWIIQKNQGNMLKTADDMKETLNRYFSRYFKTVSVDVKYVEEKENSSRVSLEIYISFTDHEDKEYTLSRLAQVVNTKIDKIIKLNNTAQV